MVGRRTAAEHQNVKGRIATSDAATFPLADSARIDKTQCRRRKIKTNSKILQEK
jgi:hypothetical protein